MFSIVPVDRAQFTLLRAITGLSLHAISDDLFGFIVLSASLPSKLLGAGVIQKSQAKKQSSFLLHQSPQSDHQENSINKTLNVSIWLTISPQFQGQGLGQSVYKHLESKYIQQNSDIIISPWQCSVDASNKSFLQSLNFQLKEECEVWVAPMRRA